MIGVNGDSLKKGDFGIGGGDQEAAPGVVLQLRVVKEDIGGVLEGSDFIGGGEGPEASADVTKIQGDVGGIFEGIDDVSGSPKKGEVIRGGRYRASGR